MQLGQEEVEDPSLDTITMTEDIKISKGNGRSYSLHELSILVYSAQFTYNYFMYGWITFYIKRLLKPNYIHTHLF
jgi:hypothetical protein